MTIDTKNLLVLAEAATPGPWHFQSDGEPRFNNVSYFVDAAKCNVIYGHCQKPDAKYIAACSPDVVLSMLDALQRKDAAIKKCYGEVIRGLADAVNIHAPDKLFDLDAIPRDPVMAIVSRIKTSMDAITKELT